MTNRVPLVDSLRGFALFGVVVSNVAVVWGSGAALVPASPLDTRIGTLEAYLVTGKFLALFSLLFGLSYGLYFDRVAHETRPTIPRYLRRVTILFVIGALHRTFFGTDILMTYAVLGAVLILFRNTSDRALLVAAIAILGVPEIWRAVAGWIGYQPKSIVSRAVRLQLATEGPYLELVRVRGLMLTQWWSELLRNGSYLSLFLLGFWAARKHLLDRPDERRQLLQWLFWGGLALTLLGFAAQAVLRPVLAGGAPWARVMFG